MLFGEGNVWEEERERVAGRDLVSFVERWDRDFIL